MKTCCQGKSRRTLLGKGDTGGWLLSGGLLLLIPKCPVCLAGYIAAVSGLGLSVPAASGLRWTLLVICIGSLALLSCKLVRRALGCVKMHSRIPATVEVAGIDPKNSPNSYTENHESNIIEWIPAAFPWHELAPRALHGRSGEDHV